MLATLKDIGRDKAQKILSQLTKKFVPSPFPSKEPEREYAELSRATLIEIHNILGLGDEPLDRKDTAKVLALLFNEIESLAINENELEEAKQRLGEKGWLSNAQYHIKFHDGPYDFEALGISRPEIEEVIRNPDAYAHLLRGIETEENLAPVSLYTKTYTHNREQLHLFVEVIRAGDTLEISAAWKIFVTDIGGFEEGSILELFKKFVAKFGVDIQIANSPWRKFHLYYATPFNKPGGLTGEDLGSLIKARSTRTNEELLISVQVRVSELGIVEATMAYAISIPAYHDALRRHGITINTHNII